MSEWHYLKDGQQQGPVSVEALREMIRAGSVGPHDLVWSARMPQWTPAARVPELIAGAGAAGLITSSDAPPVQYEALGLRPLVMSPQCLQMLRETAPWVRFLSVLIFIVSGFIVLAMTCVGLAALSGRGREEAVAGAPALVVVALYLMPAVYLNRYASRIRGVLETRQLEELEAALSAQKSFWKFVGIATAIGLGLYIVLAMVAAFAMAR